MPIDLSRVNISLQQFQSISSGKYNAGEVKLASETKLDKVNNHVHFTGSNATPLSHEEILAVKHALVKALADNGVAAETVARIRRDLGLAAAPGGDKTLHERSLRPLTRQQVRQILDDNAAAINAHAEQVPGAARIRTSAQIYGEGGMRADRADKRDEVNAALAGARGTEEHEGLAQAEAVVAGDVDFRSWDESQELLRHAKLQLRNLLAECHGRPSAADEAVVRFRMQGTGQPVQIATGMSQEAFVRKLEETIVRLSAMNETDRRSIAVRAEFGALADPVARRDWLNGLGNAPDAGFKARTAVVQMLTEAGIDDWETLSCINRVDDATALDFARSLVQLNGSLRGDDLRNDQAMLALRHLAQNGPDVPKDARATIPATSPQQWNHAIRAAIVDHEPENLPHDVHALMDELADHLRGKFGRNIIRPGSTIYSFLNTNFVDRIIPLDTAERVTAENLRARLFEAAETRAADALAFRKIDRTLMALGAAPGDARSVLNDWKTTRPELSARLLASRSAAETDAILAEFRDAIEADARRYVAVERGKKRVAAFYKEALARELGLPAALFGTGSVATVLLGRKAEALAENIRCGRHPAATEAEIEAAFRSLAEDYAAQRLAALRAVDGLQDVSPALRDALKNLIFNFSRVDKLDIPRLVQVARTELLPLLAPIDAAIRANAPKADVYAAMKPLDNRLRPVIVSLFPPDAEVGAEEMATQGRFLMATVVHSVPGFAERLEAFFARDDVKGDNFYDRNAPASATLPFSGVRSDPRAKETLAASLGSPDMPPFHAQALMQAFADAGLGALSDAEKMAVLRPSHPAGAAIASAVRTAPGAVFPSRLREIAEPILRSLGAAPAARPAADAARMNAALALYGGGLDESGRTRLRTFAEGLDFSEAAAPASEKEVAGRADEIAGGGGFGNPASSPSRRALAAGFTEADLPALAIAADATDEEDVLDPDSSFRKAWDAALLRFAGRPDRVAGLSADAKAAVALAVAGCRDEPDLLSIATAGIGRVVTDGRGHLREEDDIKRIVMDLRANLAELRAAAADDPAAFAAGLELLRGLEGRSAPAGYLKYLLDAVRRAPLDAASKLRRRSPPAEIHRAILQLNGNAFSILSGRDSGGLAEDGDTALACRHFLLRAMVSRLSEPQRRGLREALASQNAVQTVAFYDAVAANEVEMPAMPLGLHAYLTSLAATLSRDAGFLYDVVRRSLGEADANGQLPPLQGELNLPGIGARAMFNDIHATARAAIDAAREKYVQRSVPGNSPAATALRQIYNARLARPREIKPEVELGHAFAANTAKMLNLSIVRQTKAHATMPLRNTQFALDRDRVMDVILPGGALLSTDPDTAADELARFVTGREDATYATLTAGEKTKVHVVMSLLTQESSTAAIDGPTLALDPEGKDPAFNYGGNIQGTTRSFHLAKSPDGAVTVSFETTVRPTNLLIDGNLVPLGAGNEIRGGFSLTFSAEQFDAIGNLDFAECDNAPAVAEINRFPSVANKVSSAVNLLPEAFRFDLAPETSFSVMLN